jgi:large subunit ribosomal protein L22
MQATAKARYVRGSPRKARLVIDAIRGKDVKEALAILKFTPNYAARLIEKVVNSAVANAENNHKMDGENLKIAVALVDGGPNAMKRLRYAPMGRGFRIVKRMSHITIVVEETEPKPEKKRRRAGAARVAKAPKAPQKPAEAKEAKTEAAEPKPKRPRKKKSDGEAEAKGGE